MVELLGPGTAVEADEDAGLFRASSAVTGREVSSEVPLETRMSKGKVPDTDDPLLRALLGSGRARIHTVDGVETHSMEATGAEVAEEAEGGHNLVSADGEVDPAVVVLGIPAQSTQPGSAIGAAPGCPRRCSRGRTSRRDRSWPGHRCRRASEDRFREKVARVRP
ncbi:hypothetical protein [Brachybacterium sp. GPGPB12]|uniref:hypothetical protein n=1 Tax=Brachybacterium sp. GPGPB12 TaxID=3023517 RepID=UPI0031342B2B